MLRHVGPSLVLAPMEGIVDAPMRAFLGETGCLTFAVAPFVRVAQSPAPVKVFLRDVPELQSGGRTPSGLPVQVQLLGDDPECLAQSALNACSAGARAIDLNFGCPAKTVNRHGGGAELLKRPARIEEIVRAVREAIPETVPVSAKIRLGWNDPREAFEIASRAASGGASWLTVHARTRAQGYRPPAHWAVIGELRRLAPIPIVANGDIWTAEDLLRCRDQTGCSAFMLGRGALADPLLSVRCAQALGMVEAPELLPATWSDWVSRFLHWNAWHGFTEPKGAADHVKEWLRIAWTRTGKPDFPKLRQCRTVHQILEGLSCGAIR